MTETAHSSFWRWTGTISIIAMGVIIGVLTSYGMARLNTIEQKANFATSAADRHLLITQALGKTVAAMTDNVEPRLTVVEDRVGVIEDTGLTQADLTVIREQLTAIGLQITALRFDLGLTKTKEE